MKIKLNNSCFKNQSRCWTMNETPTMTEDLFPADNSDAYDIVRNSDFMVSVPGSQGAYYWSSFFYKSSVVHTFLAIKWKYLIFTTVMHFC